MDNLSQKMAKFLVESKSGNTAKSYMYSFKRWEQFIKTHEQSALPAQPIHVSLYITHLLDKGASFNTVNSAIYSIKWAHELNNFNDPTNNAYVKTLQESAKRIARPKVSKKDPVDIEDLRNLCDMFKDSSDLIDIRDITMILLSFAGFLRYDEVSSLKCNDIVIHENHFVLFIAKSKTDQYRNGNEILIAKGNTSACPYNMLVRYIELANIDVKSDSFLFRPIFRSKCVCKLIYKNKKLSYTRARETILSKLKLVSSDKDFGLHSMRSGGATTAANSNINDRCWKRHGRWKSDSSKDGYVVDSIHKRLEVSKSLHL